MIYFLNTVIDTEKRSIFNGGTRLKASTSNFDLLVYFAKHSNTIINRNELMENVWNGRVVSDATVYKQVTRLKEDLLSQISDEELIQTVHGQGFIFVLDVTSLPSKRTNTEIPEINDKTKEQTYFWLLLALILALILAFIIYQVYSIKTSNQKLNKKIERLAIVYQDESNQNSNSINPKALAQVMQSQLLMSDFLNTKLEKAKNIGQNFKQNSTTLIQDLGYDYVLNMRLQDHGEGIKAHVYLRKSNNMVPMQIFESSNLYQLVNQVTNWVIQQLQLSTTLEGNNITKSEKAFDDYIAGVRLVLQNQEVQALEKFQLAVAQDAEFWIAWNAIAVMKRNSGKINEAIEILNRIDLSKASNRLAFLVNNTRAGCYYRLGQLNQSVSAYSQALKYARRFNDPIFLVTALVNQSYMFADIKQTENARANLEEALLYVDKERQRTQLAAIYSSLSNIYSNNLFDVEKALNYAELSYKTFKAAGNENYTYVALNVWADILFNNAKLQKAQDAYQQVLEYTRNKNDTVNELFALKSLININLLYGQFDQARIQLNDFKSKLVNVDTAALKAEYLKSEFTYFLYTNNYPQTLSFLEKLNIEVSAMDNPVLAQDALVLKYEYQLAVHPENLSENDIPKIRESLTDIANQNYLAAKILANNQQWGKADGLFQNSISQYRKHGQMLKLIYVNNQYLKLAFASKHIPDSILMLLNEIEELNPPAYPFLKIKALYEQLSGNSQKALALIQQLKKQANQWWQQADENWLNELNKS